MIQSLVGLQRVYRCGEFSGRPFCTGKASQKKLIVISTAKPGSDGRLACQFVVGRILLKTRASVNRCVHKIRTNCRRRLRWKAPASLPCRSGGLLPYGLSWRVLSSELFSFDPNRPAWRHNKAEEHRRGQSCDDHADHIASSHRLRIVSNWQIDDSPKQPREAPRPKRSKGL